MDGIAGRDCRAEVLIRAAPALLFPMLSYIHVLVAVAVSLV
jgi:hypothetical protein